MPALCEICHGRPAAAQVTVVQNGQRKSISICDYDYRQLMRHQSMLNPFDSLLGGGLSCPLHGLPGEAADEDDEDDTSLVASVPRESVDVTDAFSEQTMELLQHAAEKAHELQRTELDTEHVLYVLADTDVVAALLKELKLSPDDIRRYIDEHAQKGHARPDASAERMTISPRLKKAFQFAFQASKELGHSYVGPEHVLIGLAAVPDSIARSGRPSMLMQALLDRSRLLPKDGGDHITQKGSCKNLLRSVVLRAVQAPRDLTNAIIPLRLAGFWI